MDISDVEKSIKDYSGPKQGLLFHIFDLSVYNAVKQSSDFKEGYAIAMAVINRIKLKCDPKLVMKVVLKLRSE